MHRLRVLVADDELLARKRMLRLLGALPDVEVLDAVEDGQAVLDALEAREGVDLLLLDIQMPGLSGLDASALLPAGSPTVVFTTAHPQHAVDAFGLGAADYLLKPIEAGRLQQAIERVRRRLDPRRPTQLGLPTRRGVRLVPPAEIAAAVYDGTAVIVHERGGEQRFVDLSLSELERRLPSPPFLRAHRRVLLNLDEVELLEPVDSGGYLAHLRGGLRVAVSRQRARELRRRLQLG